MHNPKDRPLDLPSLVETYPQLKFSLWERLEALTALPAGTPYCAEEEYVRDVELQFIVRAMILENSEALSRPGTQRNSDGLAERLGLIDDLRQIQKVVDIHILIRLGAATAESLPPRLLRLADRLSLGSAEIAVLQYLLVSQVGQEMQRIVVGNLDRSLLGIAAFLGLSVREAALFADPARRHVQERLVVVRTRGAAFAQELSLADPVLKALLGIPLAVNEFLSIEATALGRTLQDEPEFETGTYAGEMVRPLGEKEGFRPNEGMWDQLTRGIDTGADLDLDLEDLYHESAGESEIRPSGGLVPNGLECGRPTNSDEHLSALDPYGSDLEFLEDWFRLAANKMRIRKLELEDAPRTWDRESKDPEQLLAEYRAKETILKARLARRLEISRTRNAWAPRIERLAVMRGLDEFEKTILLTLIGANLSLEMQKAADSRIGVGGAEIGDVLVLWCDSLERMVECRKYFRRSAKLVKEGMIKLSEYSRGNFMRLDIEIDPRLLDYLVGLDVNAADLVEGSHLYTPKVNLDQVVLPRDQKQLIVESVTNFESFKSHCDKFGLADSISYGRALVMLFFGPSGTGKTMMANALATHLGKRVLLINFPSLGGASAAEVLKAIFREARIQGAVLFFDECETLFQSRDRGNAELGLLLTEMERHDGLVIMATNRPFDLDEAMHRRITLAIEFRQPDPFLRENIWRSLIPTAVPVAAGVDFRRLAMTFELSGGFIKNAVMTALSLAVSRDNNNPVVTEADLEQGARLQLRSRLRMQDFDRRVAPVRGMDALVLPLATRRLLEEIVLAEKARNILFGQWGFDQQPGASRGIAALFYGGPGTGKSLAAEAVGYEVGHPLTVVNCAELVSKYVGDTAKNIETVFKEAAQNESILVFDEADGLFGKRTEVNGSTDKYSNMECALLLYHIERFPGIVLLTTNLIDQIDEAFFRRLRFVVEFQTPDQEARQMLWRRLLPAKTPTALDLDLPTLSRHLLSGGQIRNIILRAASRIALRSGEARVLAMPDLEEAVTEELRNGRKATLGFAVSGV